jgi:hypothetical protein
MSTPTSKATRTILAAAALGALAACDPAAMGGGADRTTVSVAGRNVVVAAPSGFCVDPASTNVSASGAFVLVSDCALLGLEEGDMDPEGAVLTASVSARPLGAGASLADLQAFARTAEGRATLSRSGRADRARIVATRTRGDVLYMLIEDRGPQPIAGIEPAFWRAFLVVQGQMTVLSVLGFEGAGVGPSEGLAYLQAFADSVQRANPS